MNKIHYYFSFYKPLLHAKVSRHKKFAGFIFAVAVLDLILTVAIIHDFRSGSYDTLVSNSLNSIASIQTTQDTQPTVAQSQMKVGPTPTVTATPTPTQAQSTDNGTIRGSHKDYKNNELKESWLKITAKNLTTGTIYTTIDSPSWKITGLPAGKYRVSANVSSDYMIYYTDCVNCKNNMSDVSGNEFTVTLNRDDNFETLFKYIAKKDSVSAPVPTSTPTPTSSSGDTIKPWFNSLTGPGDGSTVNFASFCFPGYPGDNVSSASNILERHKFDSDTWSEWGSNYAPCYYNVQNGQHTFMIEIKDQAGNTSSVTRTFTVAL